MSFQFFERGDDVKKGFGLVTFYSDWDCSTRSFFALFWDKEQERIEYNLLFLTGWAAVAATALILSWVVAVAFVELVPIAAIFVAAVCALIVNLLFAKI